MCFDMVTFPKKNCFRQKLDFWVTPILVWRDISSKWFIWTPRTISEFDKK